MKNVAIVTKAFITKFETNKKRLDNDLYFNKIKSEHFEYGINLKNISSKYFENIELFSLDEIQNYHLENNFILNSFDLVLTIGGDGTFLGCSHFITNPNVLLLGINSNLNKSIGFLLQCELNMFYNNSNKIFTDLINKNYKILKRKRLVSRLSSLNIEVIGLNDLFLGLTHQTAASFYEFESFPNKKNLFRSSGLLIYTGTGSTSFAKSINRISQRQIDNILNHFNIIIDENKKLEILCKIENDSIFPADMPILHYIHRELYKTNNLNPENGKGNSFNITNLRKNAYVSIDGFEYPIEVNENVSVNLAKELLDLSCIQIIK